MSEDQHGRGAGSGGEIDNSIGPSVAGGRGGGSGGGSGGEAPVRSMYQVSSITVSTHYG